MSYEYKDAAKNALSMVYSLVGFPKEEVQRAQNELDRVYAQVPKADEYEAKAKAWDTMKKDFEDIADTPIGQQILFNMSIIMERVESGESDAKK